MATLILVRHGETDWNRDKIFRGRADIPLGDRGRMQAERVGDALGSQPIETVYTSPLSRSVQTAQAIARRHSLPVVEAEEITDIDYGVWQGRPLQEVKTKFPDLCALWESAPHEARIPGGESLDDVKDRSLPFVRAAAKKHSGRIVVVSHRVVPKVLTLGLLGLGVEKFWNVKLDTCSIAIFDLSEDRAILVRFNDVSHLAGLRDEASADF